MKDKQRKKIEEKMKELYQLFKEEWILSKSLDVDKDKYMVFTIYTKRKHCKECGQILSI